MGRGRYLSTGKVKTSRGEDAPVYNQMPKGWVVDREALTAPKGYVWINNNKGRFSGERESGLILQSKVSGQSEPVAPSLNTAKVGANFQKLSPILKSNIKNALMPSSTMMNEIKEYGRTSLQDEWTTGVEGTSEKRKVIKKYQDGKFTYTVKNKNKILLKDGTMEQAANQIAIFYNKKSTMAAALKSRKNKAK